MLGFISMEQYSFFVVISVSMAVVIIVGLFIIDSASLLHHQPLIQQRIIKPLQDRPDQ